MVQAAEGNRFLKAVQGHRLRQRPAYALIPRMALLLAQADTPRHPGGEIV